MILLRCYTLPTTLGSRTARFALLLAIVCCSLSAAALSHGWIQGVVYPIGSAISIVAGPDGALWFIPEGNTPEIGRMTTQGDVTYYPIPGQIGNGAMVFGSDGALWFTLANGVGRFTPSSGYSEYPVPPQSSGRAQIAAITSGPDGALWFTQQAICDGNPTVCSGPNVGRLTTSGNLTMYPVSHQVIGIVAGPDSALWITEAGYVGRMTTSGVLTEFSAPNLSAILGNIVAGSDGALWFVEQSSVPYIARMTTDGVLWERELYYPHYAGASQIVAGPDGSLWFSVTATGVTIIRVTTKGTVTVFSNNYTGKAAVAGTAGPNGSLWFLNGDIGIIEFPACGLGLTADHSGSTLNLNFDLSTSIPATWQTGYVPSAGNSAGTIQGLWSSSIPATVPSKRVAVPVGPGFPDIGEIQVVSLIRNAKTGGALCAEYQVVNTDGSAVTEQETSNTPVQAFFK